MITVHIVDDHKILVEGLQKLVDESGFAKTTAVSYTGKECMTQLRREQPDVLLLDINLPDASGIDLCKEIKSLYPKMKIVALTSYSEYAIVRQMMENGASGYVIKNAMPEEILMSIETVVDEQTFLCEQIDMLMKRSTKQHIWLTPREKELLKLIADGFTNAEIAEKLFLGVETVNSYRKNLLFKLGARNTAVLVKMAMEVAPKFNAELGLAITGYAEPVPELDIKTCYAFIALAENGKIVLSKKIMGDAAKSMFENQCIFVEKTFAHLLKLWDSK